MNRIGDLLPRSGWALALIAFCLTLPGQTAPPAAAEEPAYRLAPGDVIEVRLFFNPELNESVQIRPDGRISLHVAGEVHLAGKSIPEAASMLEELYRKEVRTPRVLIQVRSFAARKVYVTGEVLRPGLLGLPGTLTVFEAIQEAGGVKNTGDRDLAILIRRSAEGKPEGRRIPLYFKGAVAPEGAMLLRPFDVVVVPESRIARIDRWVDQHIRQLIPLHLAGGFTYLFQNSQTPTIPIF